MKSGLAAMLVMMLEMLATDTIPGRIRLFATIGEETGGSTEQPNSPRLATPMT